MKFILSLFPGIDLLGKAFSEQGFCVVAGPDIMTGGDIRDFHAPSGRFDAVIGGPPCQDFSRLNRRPGDYGHEMLREYIRVVQQAAPDWYLFENVQCAPAFTVPGYTEQRFDLDLCWFSEFSRRRVFQFGSRSGRLLNPMMETRTGREIEGTAVVGSDERSFSACCEIQGLPAAFDLPYFSLSGKKQAVANAVPLALGRYVAALVASEYYQQASIAPTAQEPPRRCACGCGRALAGRQSYYSATCRKKAQRARDRKEMICRIS